MKLEADARIAFPRETVFAAYRDRLPELVPHLPNVKAIRVVERMDGVDGQPQRTKMTNVWDANADIPKLLHSVVKPEALAWDDHAEWDEGAWTCRWRIEPRVFTRNVRCEGLNTFRLVGDGTVLEIRGELEVDARGIPGVPKLLAGKIAPAVEKFVVNLIKPNLISTAAGLERFLRSEQGS